jgi:DNA invertase Pin-like site-specific DNA recombinase
MSAAAIYARYSSDLQREASIEDQIRICRERAVKEGWAVYKQYSDHGISGASLMRPGIQKLLQDAVQGRFRIVVTESLDRLSRDQEDIAHIFKRISFAGGRIVTLSEGEINELHIGLKGTMGALYLKEIWPTRPDAACAAGSRPESPAAAIATATMSCAASARTDNR